MYDAYQFDKKLKLKPNFNHENQMAGNTWFKYFIERHQELFIRQVEGLSILQELNKLIERK